MIGRLLEKSIRRTEAIDREALCILAGEKVNPKPMTFILTSLRSGNCASLCTFSQTQVTSLTVLRLRAWRR